MRLPSSRAAALIALILFAAALACWSMFGRQGPAPAASAKGIPVVVGSPVVQDMPIWLASVGTVQSLNVVNVRARVEGELHAVKFVEGQEVRAGDTLAQIDPRPLEAQLRQAEANLRKDEAQLARARAEVVRYIGLAEKGFVAEATVEGMKATQASLEASAEADRAAIDTARLQLSFTTVRAPIAGRVGLRQADPGTMIRSSDANGLVSLAQIRPIAVVFAVPQDELQQILAQRNRGKIRTIADSRDGNRQLAEGELSVTDNQVDPTTGQIKLKAVFDNKDGTLWPGELVATRLLVRTDRDAIVLPARAVLSGQGGPYVYVVKPDGTAEARKVTRGSTVGDQIVIRAGVSKDEVVVFDGQSRLAPGVKVEAKRAKSEGAAAAPS